MKRGAMPAGRRHAYTLLELVVVIAIMALALTIVAVRVGGGSSRVRLKAAADGLCEFISSARMSALCQGRRVSVGSEGHRFSIVAEGASQEGTETARTHEIPDDIEVEASGNPEGRKRLYVFFPDGRGSGPRLELSLKGAKVEVAVSPLSGIVFAEEKD